MKPPGGIRWSQGMLLLPQHFQQSDLHQSAQLRYMAGVLHPFPWGVRAVSIDIDALENEILRVNRCELVFPDGIVFRYPDAGQLTERSFKEAFLPTMDSLGVYACVPADDDRPSPKRHAARREQRQDVYDPANEADIEYALPVATLEFAHDPKEKRLANFEYVKIAEIRRTGLAAPRYELSKKYIPPLIRCDGSAPLIALIRQIFEQARGASSQLGQHRRDRGAQGLSYGSGDLEQLLALQSINLFVPALQHSLAHGGGHPFDMYGLIAQLRGVLTTYSPTDEPHQFPEYVHTDLALGFVPLIESVRQLLERLLPTHYVEIQLNRDGFSFWGEIDEALFRDGGPWILAISGPGGAEALQARVMRQAKVSSTDDMRDLVVHANRGIPVRYLDLPPAEIPRSTESVYFAIDTGDARWRKVKEAGDFCCYLADADPGISIQLFVVLPKGRKQ